MTFEAARAAVNKLVMTVPLSLSREADFKKLVEQGYISSHATPHKTRERIELKRDREDEPVDNLSSRCTAASDLSGMGCKTQAAANLNINVAAALQASVVTRGGHRGHVDELFTRWASTSSFKGGLLSSHDVCNSQIADWHDAGAVRQLGQCAESLQWQPGSHC